MKRPHFCVSYSRWSRHSLWQRDCQGYPNRPVRMVIPFPPGGTLDPWAARSRRRSDQMGQTFVVENRPGGNGIIGADTVAKAPPDGYTLLFNASTFVTAPMTMKEVPYDREGLRADLARGQGAAVGRDRQGPAGHRHQVADRIREIEGAKTTFAVGSIGSAGHLATELLARAGGSVTRSSPTKARRLRSRIFSAAASTASSTRSLARCSTTRRANSASSP